MQEEFFDPHDAVQVKYEMLRRVDREGHSVTQVSADFGFSRPSFYKALADFTRRGLVGLIPEKRGPRGAHKLTEEVMAYIDAQLAENETLKGRQLAGLVEQRFGLRVHPRSIQRALERRG